MKKIIYSSIIAGCAFIISLSSCADYLDVEYIFKDQQDIEGTFASKDYSEQWLADVYSRLSDGENVIVASKGHQPFNFLADDMFFGDRGSTYEDLKNCKYNENDRQGSWNSCYEGIRNASTFIHNIDKNVEMTPIEILDNKAQARFLRAYYYWMLLRKYGPIPILDDEGLDHTLAYEALARPRNTYLECAEFIASEMALAAKDLLDTRTSREIARATKGAALAVRARVYLYAASPLFNGNSDTWASQLTDHSGRALISAQYNEELWAKAAAAAKEVIDLQVYRIHTAPFRAEDQGQSYPKTMIPPYHPQYSNASFPDGWKDIDPFESYREVFNGALPITSNSEMIFSRGVNTNSEDITIMLLHQTPRSLNGWNTHGVSLKHANTYYMNDGSDFHAYGKSDPREGRPEYELTADSEECRPLSSGVSKEYAGREARFYASIAYNGSIWECENAPESENKKYSQVFYWRGSQDGKLSTAPGFYIRTGLGIKKFNHPRDYFYSSQSFSGFPKVDIDIRYAEILLIYAEALNELNASYSIPNYLGNASIEVGRNISEMSKYMSQIRFRAGLVDLSNDVYANPTAFRKALKRERQLELFAETHRYYDLRRWKDAAIEETMPVWGCNMNMTEAQKEQFHMPVLVPSLPTIFIDKMYLWPLSHDELRRNKKLTQNPGWTSYD
ncbi:starch-binding protein [Bacteroidales bacterium]|nr:starch-binding protein [Bacteroidales bacterium]